MKTSKAKFFGELYFNKPLPGLGSVISYKCEDLPAMIARLRYYAKIHRVHCHAIIRMYDGQEWLTISKLSHADLMK